ncbi:hypothetical protein ACP70R_025015 [Stipagrostis hirtigluma subsp. patula]
MEPDGAASCSHPPGFLAGTQGGRTQRPPSFVPGFRAGHGGPLIMTATPRCPDAEPRASPRPQAAPPSSR